MSSTRAAFLFLIVGCLAASSLMAGHRRNGGAAPAKLTVINDSSVLIGVTNSPDSTDISTAVSDQSLTEFTNAGGVLVNVGGSFTYSIASGTINLGVINTTDFGVDAGLGVELLITDSVSLGAGQAITIYIVDDANNIVGISYSNTPSTSSSAASTNASGSDSANSEATTVNPAATRATAAAKVAPAAAPADADEDADAIATIPVTVQPIGANVNGAAGLNQAANAKQAAPAKPAVKKPANGRAAPSWPKEN